MANLIETLLQNLKDFAEAIEAHPDFELCAFKTFEGLSQEKIKEMEQQFYEKLREEDDFGEDLACKSYFMPYGEKEKRKKLQIPTSPVRISPLLTEFYQTTNGLQFVWEYKGLPSYKKSKLKQFFAKYTNKGAMVPWELWTSIGHHWSTGSIFIFPLEKWLRTGVEDGNFY